MDTMQEYLRKLGDDEGVARQLGVTDRTVQSWRLGTRFPQPHKLFELLDFAGCTEGRNKIDIYGTLAKMDWKGRRGD